MECQNLPKRLDLIEPDLDKDLDIGEVHWVDARDLWGELHTLPTDDQPLIIDVREPREYRQGHIAEAISIPLTQFKEGDPGLPTDREIVVVCRTSRRSQLAASALHKLGYEDLKILDGGMTSWEAAGLLEAVEFFPDNGES